MRYFLRIALFAAIAMGIGLVLILCAPHTRAQGGGSGGWADQPAEDAATTNWVNSVAVLRASPAVDADLDMNENDVTEATRIYGGSGMSGTFGIDLQKGELQYSGVFASALNWSNRVLYLDWHANHATETNEIATLGNVNTAVNNLSNTTIALATPLSFTFGHEAVQTNSYDVAICLHEAVVITQVVAYTHAGSNDFYFAKRGAAGVNPSNLSSRMWLSVSGVAETTGSVQTVNWPLPANWSVSATVSNSWGSTNFYIQLRGRKS